MARDFWQQGFRSQSVSRFLQFTSMISNLLDSTTVVETFWRRWLRWWMGRLDDLTGLADPQRQRRVASSGHHEPDRTSGSSAAAAAVRLEARGW